MALTRDAIFWDSFAAHADRSVRAAELLERLLAAPAEAASLQRQIGELEGEGDRITHDVVTALHKTWITPLDRDEIHELMTSLDDVLDYIDAAAERIALYEIPVARPESLELARLVTTAAREVWKAVTSLPRIKDANAILDLCVSINRHESEADSIYRKALARLFKERGDPIEILMWRDVFDALEAASDRLEDVADILEGIVLEHA